MANTFAPFGFLQYQGGAGGAPTFAQSTRRIASTNATAIFFGDPVVPVTGSATGYITRGTTDATTVLAGIFVGCQYLSVSQKRTVWSQYWPGSDATGDVIAYVIDSPESRFVVQTNGAGLAITEGRWTGEATIAPAPRVPMNCRRLNVVSHVRVCQMRNHSAHSTVGSSGRSSRRCPARASSGFVLPYDLIVIP